VRKRRGEETNLDCPVSWLFSRRRVNPRAATIPSVPGFIEAFPAIPGLFF